MTDRPGLGREAFLARLSATDARGLPPPMPTHSSLWRLVGVDDDLVTRFTEETRAAGNHVHITDRAGLSGTLAGMLASLEVRRATVSMTPGEDARAVRQALEVQGCTEVDWRLRDGIDAHYDVDVGITDVAAGLAETGSMVLRSDADHSRGAHLAPPIHIAILHGRQILADMIDLFPEGRSDPMPSLMVIITGPSKTADIEGILITGVHGPGAVHVLLVLENS